MSYNPFALGTYNSTPPTLTNGQSASLQLDANGNLLVLLAKTIAGEDINNNVLVVENRYNYVNITTQTTTTIKSISGFLQNIIINTPVANSVITIYDSTTGSGTKIGTITLPATLLDQGPMPAMYNVTFSNGLTIVTSGASSDITVAYR